MNTGEQLVYKVADILCFADLVLLTEAVTFMSLIQVFGGGGNPTARYLERRGGAFVSYTEVAIVKLICQIS